MPVIFLLIPVSELLETIRHLLANGKEVRVELLNAVMIKGRNGVLPRFPFKTHK